MDVVAACNDSDLAVPPLCSSQIPSISDTGARNNSLVRFLCAGNKPSEISAMGGSHTAHDAGGQYSTPVATPVSAALHAAACSAACAALRPASRLFSAGLMVLLHVLSLRLLATRGECAESVLHGMRHRRVCLSVAAALGRSSLIRDLLPAAL